MAIDRWTEAKVFDQLRHIFPSPAYVRLPQVRNGTGYARARTRTADAIIVSAWPSRGLWLAGVEIKVSVADWKKELAHPEKANEIQQYCHHWYIACPQGLINEAIVPKTWGLIEVNGTTAEIARRAPELTPKPVDLLLVCSILRAAADATVAKDLVDDMVSNRVHDAIEGENRRRQYESNRLADSVAAFEEASGVKIGSPWDAGNIGAAVAFVQKVGVSHAKAMAERLATECERAADGFRKAIRELDGGTVCVATN